MALLACNGATTMCTMGTSPGTLMVLPINKVLSGTPVANIMDNKPIVNIVPFGMCISPANPMVAAATAAAMGVLTPMPCIPNPPAPWVPGAPKVLIGSMPALDMTSKCMCAWAGVISILSPGEVKVLAG